jgi:hypothetical protein
MAILINALEEIVANQASQIIADLNPAVVEQISPREIIAYALNRLPPMYATSHKGFSHLRAQALNNMGYQIHEMLQRGVQRVLMGDPIYDPTPLPDEFFTDSAAVLNRLCQLFNRDYMRWRDVAIAVQSTIFRLTAPPVEKVEAITAIQPPASTDEPTGGSPRLRAELAGLKSYLKRAKAKQRIYQGQTEDETVIQPKSGWTEDTTKAYGVMIAYDELVLYLLRPRLRIVNVMEHLVQLAIEKIANPEAHKGSRPIEISAYALNRLPPLYCTSINGYNITRQRAINELSKDVILAVRNGALKVIQSSPLESTSPFATDFEKEAEDTLKLLRKLLDREDVDMRNVVQVVRDFVFS